MTQNSENGDKKTGAYRRVQDKNVQSERKKGSGWISKMKQRQKAGNSQSGTALQSFAGETVSSDGRNEKVSIQFKCQNYFNQQSFGSLGVQVY